MLSHLASSASFFNLASSARLAGDLCFASTGGFCEGKMVSMNCSICKVRQQKSLAGTLQPLMTYLPAGNADFQEVGVVWIVLLMDLASIPLKHVADHLQVLR